MRFWNPCTPRFPVYEGEIDNIIGVLSTKALTIEARRTSFDKLDVRTLLKPAYFVPENRRTDALFREMQANKIKLAILIERIRRRVRYGDSGGSYRGNRR